VDRNGEYGANHEFYFRHYKTWRWVCVRERSFFLLLAAGDPHRQKMAPILSSFHRLEMRMTAEKDALSRQLLLLVFQKIIRARAHGIGLSSPHDCGLSSNQVSFFRSGA
jgi:hypothetical protein